MILTLTMVMFTSMAIVRERLVWHPAAAAEPFTLPLEELFRPL